MMQNGTLIAFPTPSSGCSRSFETFGGRRRDPGTSGLKSGSGTFDYCPVEPRHTQCSGACRCESATAETGTVKVKLCGHNQIGSMLSHICTRMC